MTSETIRSQEREKKRKLRRETANWQKAALCMFAASVVLNAAQSLTIGRLHNRAKALETNYNAAIAIERDAVNAYVELAEQVETERAARAVAVSAEPAGTALKSIGTFTVTGYCACEKCCGKSSHDPAYGVTASGAIATQGRTIAVDPDIIPLGSTVYIESADGVLHSYVAEDTGGAITGNRIDIFFTDHQTAKEFGVREIEVWCNG